MSASAVSFFWHTAELVQPSRSAGANSNGLFFCDRLWSAETLSGESVSEFMPSFQLFQDLMDAGRQKIRFGLSLTSSATSYQEG
jgi:hypothetical protein